MNAPELPFFPLVCPLKHFVGIACPTCGLGHAVWALVQGDIEGSWRYHPGLLIGLAVLVLCFVFPVLKTKLTQNFQRHTGWWLAGVLVWWRFRP